MRTRARFRTITFFLLLAFLIAIPRIVDLYADWLWFGEVGYEQVFLRTIGTKAAIMAVAFLGTFALLSLNLSLALGQTPRSHSFIVMTPEGPQTAAIEPRRFKQLATILAFVAATLTALIASSKWNAWLSYRHATPFGSRDPILGKDVGFYVFELSFLQFIQGGLLLVFGLTFAGVIGAYFLTNALGVDPMRGFFVSREAKRHLSLLAAAIFLLLAFGSHLLIPDALTNPSGILHGASYVDVEVRLPLRRFLSLLSLGGAGLAILQMGLKRLWPLAAAAGSYALVALGGSVFAGAVQRLVVAPNEQAKETPFIVHNIEATRRAFGIDDVEGQDISGDAALTREDIEEHAVTLKNVPLWDHQQLLDTFGQIQEIRTYYDFASVDNDRYVIDGEYRQIMLSARELNSSSLPNRNWINERLTFTHGYGLTLGPVNQVTPEGLPVLFIKNLPPDSSVDLAVTEPSIYFGELSNDHVFVRTKTQEFHYPKGEDNVTAKYEGSGGIPVHSFFRKLLFSIKFRSMKALLSDDLTKESRVLFRRRILDRVREIAPFLSYDRDPYLAISDGRLFWIQDAYTTSKNYPYSSPARGGINYIRNSVKVVIDAYHGTTTFFLIDPEDPVAATFDRAFPGLFRAVAEMPAGLRDRLRYPETIFETQAEMFSTFHMTNPGVFYNKEDQWEIPSLDSGREAVRIEPYYTIMRLPGEPEAEFIQMLPFTPRQKDNLAAWMVARSDGENYGRLKVFQFPKQKVVYGPRQVVARINQDQAISPQITLWNQQGSEVIQGTLLVIPIEESLLYIRPLYLRAAGGRIPELKRVIVAYQNQIVMEETLEKGLARIFAPEERSRSETAEVHARETKAEDTPPSDLRSDEPSKRAWELYQSAIRAQREGNWALYGEDLERLGRILKSMAAGEVQGGK